MVPKKIAEIISVLLGLRLFLQYEDLICLYCTALYTFSSLLNATIPSKWCLGDVTHNKRMLLTRTDSRDPEKMTEEQIRCSLARLHCYLCVMLERC